MSASEAAVVYPVGAETGRRGKMASPANWLERLTPKQGWDTFALAVATIGVAAWTVREANWVETPGLMLVVLLSSLTGLLLAKVRAPWPLLHVAGLSIGLLVATWQTTWLLQGQSLVDEMREVWDRTAAWYEVAGSGGINTDLLPSTLFLLSLAWLLGYVSSFFLFRNTNVWVCLILGGVSVLTTLSFLPDVFASRFFLFLLLAMLLLARVSVVQRQDEWRRSGLGPISNGGRRLAVLATVGISVVVLAIAAGVPLKVYVSQVAVDIWNLGRSPIAGVEDEFARLFAGIPTKKDVNGRFFGNTLPFQGRISFGGDIVMWTNSREPSYWLSRTYSKYTSQGWMAGESNRQHVGPESSPPPPHESAERELAFQSVQLTFDSDDLFSGGNVDWVSHDAVVETLAPLEFRIDLRSDVGDSEFSEDIRELAKELRRLLDPPPNRFVESLVSEMLPDDLVLVNVAPGGDTEFWKRQDSVTVARKEPEIPDVVAWRFAERFKANDTYTMYSFISNASNDQLRAAGADYGGFVKDHYLALPDSLPQRVRDLAKVVTKDAQTPLDKALAIQSFLRDEGGFVYSQDIERPPRDADGVDHFLFETKTGYSDYYASAMTVMLRAVGVPARMAAGYAPGEERDTAGQRMVKDSDSHGWTQVYFPGHGWIDFEPTSNWPLTEHGSPAESGGEPEIGQEPLDIGPYELAEIDDLGFECDDPLIDPEDIDDPAECQALGLWYDTQEGPQDTTWSPGAPELPLAVALAIVAAIWAAARLLWTRGLGNATPAERVYTKMGRLGTLAGLGRQSHQTPIEYATFVGDAIPKAASGAQLVAWRFAAVRYGKREPADDLGSLNDAWKSIRGGMLSRILRRLVPLGKSQ